MFQIISVEIPSCRRKTKADVADATLRSMILPLKIDILAAISAELIEPAVDARVDC